MKGRVHDRIIKKRLLIDRNDLKYFEKLNNLEELYKKYNKNTLIKDFIYDVKKKKNQKKLSLITIEGINKQIWTLL